MLTDTQKRSYEFFRQHLSEYLADPLKRGKWAVLHETDIVGLFDNVANAADFAFSEYGAGNFIVQEIYDPDEELQFVKWEVTSCV